MWSFAIFFLIMPFISSYHVVIIPGLGGSSLHESDMKKTRVWPPSPSIRPAKPIDIICHENGTCKSLIPLRTLDIGDKQGIRVDTTSTYVLTKNNFYYPLIKKLEEQNATVSAFPYDFRLINRHHLYPEFKRFFESRNESLTVVCHSLGGLVFHDFLVTQTDPQWQKKHISRVCFFNVPFGGSPEALFTLLHNEFEKPLYIPLFHMYVRTLHHFEGLYWCLPIPGSDIPILRWNRTEWYSGSTIDSFFRHLKLSICLRLYQQTAHQVLIHRKKPIHVPSYIIYGRGINTTCFMDWKTKTCLYEDGDGTVPLSSLLLPKTFYFPNQTTYVGITGMQHGRLDEDCLPLFNSWRETDLNLE